MGKNIDTNHGNTNTFQAWIAQPALITNELRIVTWTFQGVEKESNFFFFGSKSPGQLQKSPLYVSYGFNEFSRMEIQLWFFFSDDVPIITLTAIS